MFSRRAILMGSATLVGFSLLPSAALAQIEDVFATSDGVAINGYDSVAYFLEEKPVLGSDEFTTEYKHVIWKFASSQNRDMFVGDPQKYAPQYGGYCAYAVALGATASTDPAAWTIYNGKLYLNFSLGVRSRWRRDPDKYIEMADKNWPGVLD